MAFAKTPGNDLNYRFVGNPSQSQDPNAIIPDIIQDNPDMPIAKRTRQVMSWRVPGIGKVDMYINPEQMSISENKVIKTQRTKGGFVVQYWGEDLIKISINGSTGSSSIEGINILRQVYRAEQNSFQQVAATLADRFQEYVSGNTLSGIVNSVSKATAGDITGTIMNTLIGGAANPPLLPTLGSLATAVEMYYQGWVFKGFFTSISITESTALGAGIFDYKIDFTVFDRRGIRTNFTSFARSPGYTDQNTGKTNYISANSNYVPLSFKGEK